MTRDEVEKLAEQSGLSWLMDEDDEFVNTDKMLVFANLIAKHTQERCAKVCQDRYMGDNNREDMEARRCAEAIMQMTV